MCASLLLLVVGISAMVITVLLGGPVYTGTVESESAARKVLQTRAKAEEQSLECGDRIYFYHPWVFIL